MLRRVPTVLLEVGQAAAVTYAVADAAVAGVVAAVELRNLPVALLRCERVAVQNAKTSHEKMLVAPSLGPSSLAACEDGKASSFGRMGRSEEHTSELQSLMRISYAVFCLKKKNAE